MPTLVVDIETVGEDFDQIDPLTQAELTKNIQADPKTPEYTKELDQVKRNLVFSPVTGRIITIGVLDVEKNQAVVYFDSADEDLEESVEENVTYKPMTEAQMLESFWGGVRRYDVFVTWNGRAFDVPYLMVRSAVHGVIPSQDLMAHRYLGSQRFGVKHIDLYDQVRFYGAVQRPGSLHLWCRALGIDSPKSGDVAASDVGEAFRQGKFLEIAQYNARDLFATKAVYEHWKKYFQVS